jgi:hypothetical protein
MLGSSQDLTWWHKIGERHPSSYCYGPVVQRWTTHTSLRRQAWWWRRPPVMIPLSGRVPGRASEPSRTRVDDGGGYGTFCGWRLGCLGFSWGCEYIGGRARSVGAWGAHTMGRCGQGAPRHHQVWPPCCPTLSPLRTPWTCQKNRNFSFCFVQFQEYFLQ